MRWGASFIELNVVHCRIRHVAAAIMYLMTTVMLQLRGAWCVAEDRFDKSPNVTLEDIGNYSTS